MVNVVRQRQMNILHPYMVEVYVAVDGSEACLFLNPLKAYCAQNGAVKEVRLEMEFSRYETYGDKIREAEGAIGVYHSGERIRKGALDETDETPSPLNQPFCQPSPPPS
jgi:hypothetical protein